MFENRIARYLPIPTRNQVILKIADSFYIKDIKCKSEQILRGVYLCLMFEMSI